MTAERSRTGRLLNAELPEEYRFRDVSVKGEVGDLEAYLHGFGDLLDLVRATLKQLYTDSFAEPIDENKSMQSWVTPYMADVVGAQLESPNEEIRKVELANAVTWRKGKGTLSVVDAIADVLSGAEGVAIEGWRKTLTTPRNWLPPFSHKLNPELNSDYPPVIAEHHFLPSGTPDLRLLTRAVETTGPGDILHRFKKAFRDAAGSRQSFELIWKMTSEKGAPCFPGSYEDPIRVTPDLREPGLSATGVNPTRLLVYVAPPFGFFEPGLLELPAPGLLKEKKYAPKDFPGGENLDKIILTGDPVIPPGKKVTLENLLLKGTITVKPDAQLKLENCAVKKVVLETNANDPEIKDPKLTANNCLFEEICGFEALIYLDYSTVMKKIEVGSIWASDSILGGKATAFDCAKDKACIRFSRVPPDIEGTNCPGIMLSPNTTARPNFAGFQFCSSADKKIKAAEFGEPGSGVLSPATNKTIKSGAEDGGEMGAYHHQHHMATLSALIRKLEDHLPCGITPVIIYDPRLSMRPPIDKNNKP
ncbi:MAG: hypothetical protein V3R64_06725 [Sphingomonadales bacterium]